MRQFTRHTALKLSSQSRMRGLVGGECCIPCCLATRTIGRAPTVINLLRNLELGSRPTQRSAGSGHFILTQRRTVAGFFTCLGRRTKANGGAAANQRGFVIAGQCRVHGGFD